MLNLTQEELKELYHDNKTSVWQYKTLYQIHYGINSGYSLQIVARLPKNDSVGVSLKGRFAAMENERAYKFLFNNPH